LNRNNTIATTLHYCPYGGNRIWPTVSTLTTKRFTGQYQEIPIPGGGLYYYGARWYDAFSGCFISADTIVPDAGNPQDLNRYSYVRNNPVK
jgi:RHS repeat-associated protein